VQANALNRILHITDPHLFADPDASLRGTVTRQSLQHVLDHILASDWPADVVTVTGDLIQDKSIAAYQQFCSMLSQLKLPVYCVPGNHDIRKLMKPALQKRAFHYCEQVRLGNWLMIGIDSCRPGDTAAGEISPDEFDRLSKVLDASEAQHVLLCLHHPPLPVGSQWLDSVGLDNAGILFQFITRHPSIKGAIFGHVHQQFDSTSHNVRIIGTPSTCRQFRRGSDEFAVDDKPPAYRRITLSSEGTIDDELVWVTG